VLNKQNNQISSASSANNPAFYQHNKHNKYRYRDNSLQDKMPKIIRNEKVKTENTNDSVEIKEVKRRI